LPTEVTVSEQVRGYQRSLAPEPRRRLKQGIIRLGDGRGDIKALSENLAGFHRLRVGEHRVIYRYHRGRIECFYAAPRSIVYEYLAAHVRDVLSGA
jgi:mRNA-degrading endonuclease RelE of RelBE toxin-antitoxin system